MKIRSIILAVLCCFFIGCGAKQIAKENYSQLATPEETFEFIRETVKADDPEAFHHCLASYIQEQVSVSQLRLAWTLAGSFFGVLLQAKLKNVETPAPDLSKRTDIETAKMTVGLQNLEAAFLMIREQDKWKIASANHYPLPDISELPSKGRLPWRSMETAYYPVELEDWGTQEKINRNKEPRKDNKRLPWRNDSKKNYLQQQPRDWYSEKK